MLAIVVDDILHAATSRSLIDAFSNHMDKTYRIKHLGTPRLMIGLSITSTSEHITLDQAHYIRAVATKFKQTESVRVHSPACVTGCLGSAEVGDSTPLDLDAFPYMSLLGSLLWVTLTRPDVVTVVSRACSHGAAPTRAHWRAAIRILRYLLSTCEHGLRFPISKQDPSVSAYVDAAFANEPGRKSRYGYAVFLGPCLVSWASKCTTMVCLSTAEAEFVAATEAAKDVVWLRGLLLELGFSLTAPSVLLEDHQACVSMIRNNSVSGRNRHFAVKMAWLRDQVSSKILAFVFVPSKHNCSDIFTKVLPDAQFRLLRDRLMLGVQTRGGVSK